MMDKTFYDELYGNDSFAQALGRLVLSSAKFEASLKKYMDLEGKVNVSEKSPLGRLLILLFKNHEIDTTAKEHFRILLHQRNYFVHKLYKYLSVYPQNKSEVQGFVNRANGVSEEMEFFSKILLEKASENNA